MNDAGEKDPLEPGAEASELLHEEDEKRMRVLVGELENLPSLSSKIVRIFTSSTFTDTTLERNNLMEKVYPRLKEYCREKHGLEFQVVDMRWGVRDEATDDHMTTQLCMQEIDNCQRLSMGPNFVVFLGQKYGYRPLPTHIVTSEFEMLRDCVKSEEHELKLLDEWYQKDANAVPPVHVLQPISSILTNFNNKRHQRLAEQDQAAWWDTFGKIQRILRKAAQVLFITKKIDREQMHNYFMSVTEREVERGILKAPDVEEHCLAYVRDIVNINTTLLRIATKFVDFAARNVDGEAQKLLKILRDERLPQRIPASNFARFVVEWTGKEGIDSDTHAEYFNTFCQHFQSSIIRLVDRAMAKHARLASDPVYTEALQHLHACKLFCSLFQGREEVVEKIQVYVTGSSREPLVLYGESGCGKTSLMAKAASQVKEWFKVQKDTIPMMILRFLGTTPGSSTIIPMLTSLCRQLSILYSLPRDDIPEEVAPLAQHFKKMLTSVPEDKPLVLFLDSLDQLSGADGAHQLTWLPSSLPENVKLIVSTLPNYYNLLNTLKLMVESEDNYVQVLPLGENLSSTILKAWLKRANRTVLDSQWEVVTEAFSKCNLPLFVKLVFDEICRWKSYTKPNQTTLAGSIHDSITKLFERIELQHGKTLVSHALGFITASKSGLSEAELEDLLSLDDKVLNDVYQYHLPPTRRIPPLLWTRIRADLPSYLSEREADGVNVIGWYHRQFIDAARERYFKNLNFVSDIHSNIADYFLGTWGGGIPKPFEYSELQRQRFCLEETKGESDRKLPPQPLVFLDSQGKVIRHNLRKLSELPYHLIRSHRYDDLYDKVLFNYNWLHAKLSSMPLQSVLADFEDLLEHVFDKDVKLIADAIRLSASILSHYPAMLGPQITGRLLPYYGQNPKISSLIEQCDTDGVRHCALVPAFHYLHTPSGPLQYSLEGHPFAPFGIASTSDGKYLVSVSNKIILWDLSTGSVVRNIVPGIEGIMQNLVISPNDKYAVSFTNNNQVVLCSIKSGEFLVIKPKMDGKTENVAGTTVSNSQIAIWTNKSWYLYTLEGQLLSKQQSELKMPIIQVELDGDRNYLIVKSGGENDSEMALEVQDKSVEAFEFHSAIALSPDRTLLYTCIEISDNAVTEYRLEGNAWRYSRTLGENVDPVIALTLSPDTSYLVATMALGFKLWDLASQVMRELRLPHGTRNIPNKLQLTSLVVFTKGNQFVVAGVRKNLYVWDVKQGNLVKTLDAHFGRIIALTSVCQNVNAVISSSLDKTIKVWNFDKILEEVHPIDRLEKPLETIHLASAESKLCVTTTRNLLAVWNLDSGRLVRNYGSHARSAIITNAVITQDAKYIVSSESGGLVFWSLESENALANAPQPDIQALLLNEKDTRIIAVSKATGGKGICTCHSIPDGKQVYKFDYPVKKFRPPVLTKDGTFLAVPASDKSGDVVGVYNAVTGAHSYNLQLKYNNYLELSHLAPLPHDNNQVAVVDSEKSNVLDLKKKTLVRSTNRWNGMATQNGRTGLYAPSRGGLELIETRTGKTIRVLIPRVAEGVFSIDVMFTRNDKHVLYYHSGHRTIRLFRVADGKMIANFKAHAEVKAMVGTHDGSGVVIGAVDGSLTLLMLADAEDESSLELLRALPSRQVQSKVPATFTKKAEANGNLIANKNAMGTALQVARFVAKTRGAQQSKACSVS